MTTERKIILGIDPGLTHTGYAVIDTAMSGTPPLALGEIKTTTSQPLGKRLEAIHAGLLKITAKHHPTTISVEALFSRINVKTALQMAQARGVALLAATSEGAELFEYAPAEIKRIVAGSGRADKTQMMAMVRALVPIKRKTLSEHMADALAAAICHRQHLQILAGGRVITRTRSRAAKRRQWQRFVEERDE